MLEKRIQRMLKLTEERAEEQTIEAWQLNQVKLLIRRNEIQIEIF